MAKKKEEITESHEEVHEVKGITELALDFGRADLNEVVAKLNEVIRRIN